MGPAARNQGKGNSMTNAKTALVVRGGWDGHQPTEATELYIPFLQANGYTVRVEESPEIYADGDYLASVDLIIQCATMSAITGEQVKGLRTAVENGTGLAGWHGGIVDAYRENSDYLQLVGGQFAGHPGQHPDEPLAGYPENFVAYTVNLLPAAQEHPITTGITDFDLVTEQYWLLADDYNDVLATTTQRARPGDPWHREVTSPAIWTRRWGRGRIFVSAPGHDTTVLQDDNIRTIIERGLLWASR